MSSFTDLPRVFGSIVAAGLDSGNGITPSGKLPPYAFLLHTQNTKLFVSGYLQIEQCSE